MGLKDRISGKIKEMRAQRAIEEGIRRSEQKAYREEFAKHQSLDRVKAARASARRESLRQARARYPQGRKPGFAQRAGKTLGTMSRGYGSMGTAVSRMPIVQQMWGVKPLGSKSKKKGKRKPRRKEVYYY